MDQGRLRKREHLGRARSGGAHEPLSTRQLRASSTVEENGAPSNECYKFSWRRVVRWTARFLLLVTVFLSSATVVRISSETNDLGGASTVLLVIAHARPDYLQRSLESVFGNEPTWPVVVSIDCQDGSPHTPVREVVSRFQESLSPGRRLDVWYHDHHHDGSVSSRESEEFYDIRAYERISRHYRWAINRVFSLNRVTRVVILEDDLEVAPDFFSYFNALSPLLDSDPTLFCISAWNDNGKEALVLDPKQLHRTDFFPGLGWMISRQFWNEVKEKWPDIYWDDWLRSRKQTRGRQCVRPEVSRTANFGAVGVSQSFNFEKHVSKVVLNKQYVDFSSVDMSYLSRDAYEQLIFGRISRAVLLKFSNYLTSKPQNADVIARYPPGNMEAIGKRTGIMIDHREGIFRTSYEGVVIVPWNGHWAFIVARDWKPPPGRNYSLGASECCGR